MNDSLRIGSVFGITIRVHYLFLVMVGALVLMAPSPGLQLVVLSMLFLLVFLHELGHSLVAQSFGIRVLDITFWPLGGMARMSDIPENPRVEGWIAIAGPAVNFALAALGMALLSVLGGLGGLMQTDLQGVLGSPLTLFIAINLVLGSFNLLPAFPMDGGRVLRAFLARKRDWVSATETAVRVGRWLALFMAVYGVLQTNCILVLIAGFVWIVGARELAVVRMRHFGHPFGRHFPFGGAAPQPPTSPPFHEPPAEAGESRRPQVIDPEGPAPQAGKGFSEDDVRRLERFQGRLRRPRGEA